MRRFALLVAIHPVPSSASFIVPLVVVSSSVLFLVLFLVHPSSHLSAHLIRRPLPSCRLVRRFVLLVARRLVSFRPPSRPSSRRFVPFPFRSPSRSPFRFSFVGSFSLPVFSTREAGRFSFLIR